MYDVIASALLTYADDIDDKRPQLFLFYSLIYIFHSRLYWFNVIGTGFLIHLVYLFLSIAPSIIEIT